MALEDRSVGFTEDGIAQTQDEQQRNEGEEQHDGANYGQWRRDRPVLKG